jgi:hypothetical protein
MLLYNGLSRYLEHRAYALYGADNVLPNMIRNVVSKFLEVTKEVPEDKRGSYIRSVCEILVKRGGISLLRSLIHPRSSCPSRIYEDDASAIALSFAMLMGNDNIADLLLAQDVSPRLRNKQSRLVRLIDLIG